VRIRTQYAMNSDSEDDEDAKRSPFSNSKLMSVVNDISIKVGSKVMVRTQGFKLPELQLQKMNDLERMISKNTTKTVSRTSQVF
jgi:hypothetical protein